MDPQPILSFWGPEPVPLPPRFARVKSKLIAGHEQALEASFARLIACLRAEVDHIEGLGPHLIPSVEFADVDNPAQANRFCRDLRRYGVGVIRGVLPRADAAHAVHETVDYLNAKKRDDEAQHQQSRRQPNDPTCIDVFWSPAQVRSRAHPCVLRAQKFMLSMWDADPSDGRVAPQFPITYADRIRISGFDPITTLTSNNNTKQHGKNNSSSNNLGASCWWNELESSGVIAQIDNGSLERWEPDGYQRTGTFDAIFKGNWEEWNPWECASRVSATTDLYNGHGACSIMRLFQGVMALTTVEPGIFRLLPSPKLATAYFLLRPFFTPKTSPPPYSAEQSYHDHDAAWKAFLSPENWTLCRDQDSVIHGAVPGHAQRVTEMWHPHLELRRSMITLPTLQPGDYIVWHPEVAYHISDQDILMTNGDANKNPSDIGMLVYLPVAPLTQVNALYLARQRKTFWRGHPAPDFDSAGSSRLGTEAPHDWPRGEDEIAKVGGVGSLQAMGLAPWEELRGLGTAEEEAVRLANLILFPDKQSLFI